jgi:glycerate 2-kinase
MFLSNDGAITSPTNRPITHPQKRPTTLFRNNQKAMKILISPSGFKESVEPHVAAKCIEEGILRAVPDAIIRRAPLVDGGEGFAAALVTATNGQLRHLEVIGPVKSIVKSHYGFLGRPGPKTAVIEMAAAAGLSLVPRNIRDPTITTTYGVGQTIVAALNEGAQHIIVGCGDSGTSDGGAGMAQALGARFLDTDGNELPHAGGGATLSELADIDFSGLHPGLKEVKIDAACNWQNVLCGPKGVARVFGPQKGATLQQVELLATALDKYAAVLERKLHFDVSQAPGSGASGGLGAGLMLIGAKLHPRYDIIMQFFDLDALLDDCQLVFTAEGGIDSQTPRGKIPAEVAMRAKRRGLPVIALAGTVGPGASDNYEVGIDAFASILQAPTSLEEAIHDAERLLKDSAESAMRMVIVGTWLRDDDQTQDSSPLSTSGVTGKPNPQKVSAKVPFVPMALLKTFKMPKGPYRIVTTNIAGERNPLVTA